MCELADQPRRLKIVEREAITYLLASAGWLAAIDIVNLSLALGDIAKVIFEILL
jgi:hypothetical protein